MNQITLSSPAKLNLHLSVLGRMPDGYHRLYTLFHRISLADTLTLKKTGEGFRLRTNHAGLPLREGNILYRAHEILRKCYPGIEGVDVSLKKKIPVGAGLGGGSSNAAFFLLGMNRLYRLGMSRRRMLAMGRRLGADVPFFLYEVNQAAADGRGDLIRPRPAKRRWWFVLALSSEGLSTRDVFQNYRIPRPGPSLTKARAEVRMLCANLDQSGGTGASLLLHNDLETSAFRLRPSIQNLIKRIRGLGHSAAGMSGSGPTVFAMFPQEKAARSLAGAIRKWLPSGRIEVVHTL